MFFHSIKAKYYIRSIADELSDALNLWVTTHPNRHEDITRLEQLYRKIVKAHRYVWKDVVKVEPTWSDSEAAGI